MGGPGLVWLVCLLSFAAALAARPDLRASPPQNGHALMELASKARAQSPFPSIGTGPLPVGPGPPPPPYFSLPPPKMDMLVHSVDAPFPEEQAAAREMQLLPHVMALTRERAMFQKMLTDPVSHQFEVPKYLITMPNPLDMYLHSEPWVRRDFISLEDMGVLHGAMPPEGDLSMLKVPGGVFAHPQPPTPRSYNPRPVPMHSLPLKNRVNFGLPPSDQGMSPEMIYMHKGTSQLGDIKGVYSGPFPANPIPKHSLHAPHGDPREAPSDPVVPTPYKPASLIASRTYDSRMININPLEMNIEQKRFRDLPNVSTGSPGALAAAMRQDSLAHAGVTI